MEDYNPPSTSAQACCFGCRRERMKVQELMDLKYITNLDTTLMKHRMEEQIRRLQKQVDIEQLKKKNLCTMLENGLAGTKKMLAEGGEPTEEQALRRQVDELKAANEELVAELEKMKAEAQKEPEPLPFEQWKDAMEQYCDEQLAKMRNCLVEQHNLANYYKDECRKKTSEMTKCKRQYKMLERASNTLSGELMALQRQQRNRVEEAADEMMNVEEEAADSQEERNDEETDEMMEA